MIELLGNGDNEDMTIYGKENSVFRIQLSIGTNNGIDHLDYTMTDVNENGSKKKYPSFSNACQRHVKIWHREFTYVINRNMFMKIERSVFFHVQSHTERTISTII